MDIIADEIIRKGLPKGNETVNKIAKEICKIFPSECEVSIRIVHLEWIKSINPFCLFLKEVYYLPPRSRGPTQKHSAGILINKLRNFKTIKSKVPAQDNNDNENIRSLNGKIQLYMTI